MGVKDGYQAYIMFVVQMKNVSLFMPNRDTQPEFADALLAAREAAVVETAAAQDEIGAIMHTGAAVASMR